MFVLPPGRPGKSHSPLLRLIMKIGKTHGTKKRMFCLVLKIKIRLVVHKLSLVPSWVGKDFLFSVAVQPYLMTWVGCPALPYITCSRRTNKTAYKPGVGTHTNVTISPTLFSSIFYAQLNQKPPAHHLRQIVHTNITDHTSTSARQSVSRHQPSLLPALYLQPTQSAQRVPA